LPEADERRERAEERKDVQRVIARAEGCHRQLLDEQEPLRRRLIVGQGLRQQLDEGAVDDVLRHRELVHRLRPRPDVLRHPQSGAHQDEEEADSARGRRHGRVVYLDAGPR
jgi:hypothetical protein